MVSIKTYQDLLDCLADDGSLKAFILQAIFEHKASKSYKAALDAELYFKNENPTITKYQKLLYTMTGKAVPDNFSANHKLASNVYFRFITQTVQYLLGYGLFLRAKALRTSWEEIILIRSCKGQLHTL